MVGNPCHYLSAIPFTTLLSHVVRPSVLYAGGDFAGQPQRTLLTKLQEDGASPRVLWDALQEKCKVKWGEETRITA